MLLRFLAAFVLGAMVMTGMESAGSAPAYAGAAAIGSEPAYEGTAAADGAAVLAQACLSGGQARAAVQSGRAIPLSQLISRIRAAAGGQVLPQPQLCASGGRLVYLINVLTGNGQIRSLTVDAASGSILGY